MINGGYFIIKGKEKIVNLYRTKSIIFYTSIKMPMKKLFLGNIKSISNEGLQSSRTNLISIIKHNLIVKSNGEPLKRSGKNTIVVRILGIDISVPLFILEQLLWI